jgi:plastocyanin
MSSKSTTIGTRRGIIGALLAALALAAPASSQAAPPKLVASVGPGLTISLKTAAGKKVTALTRGTYQITVNDKSRIHDFRLRGPGVSKALSGVAAVGTKTVTVRLGAGKYQFVCQPHANAMKGAFSVR